MPLLTFTTDFGLRDAYVPAMKGVVLSLQPGTAIVDVTHDVPPQDVMHAAFVLKEAYSFFPPGTVHVVVVDPGVGTARRPIALRAGEQVFVGPDNGVFALVLGEEGFDEAVVLDRPEYWRAPDPSATFHGRDIFAPVAAHLAAGYPLQAVGSPLSAIKPLRWPLPLVDAEGVRGFVIHVDRYGNCITNIRPEHVEQHRAGRAVRCYVGNTTLKMLHRTYGDVPQGDPLLLYGSAGLLEVAVNAGNAAELLAVERGSPLTLVYTSQAA